jgi:hypothetical protein
VSLTPEQVAALGAIVTAVVLAGMRGVWVWGWVYKELVKQLDQERREKVYWRGVALRSLDHADHALKQNEALTDKQTLDDA